MNLFGKLVMKLMGYNTVTVVMDRYGNQKAFFSKVYCTECQKGTRPLKAMKDCIEQHDCIVHGDGKLFVSSKGFVIENEE